MIPFEPESIESARARLSAALVEMFDPTTTKPKDLPSSHRKHVFDFEDGMRLIVSYDLLIEHEPVVHVSASYTPGVGDPLVANGVQKFIQRVRRRWRELGRSGTLELHGFSNPKGVPHFVERPVN